MNPIRFMTIASKGAEVYQRFCRSVCQKYGINQTAFDVVMFLANNPDFNTARDICKLRGIKSGIVSVTVEQLIQNGYLKRENDREDRRLQRLNITDQALRMVEDGRSAQEAFECSIFQDFSQEECEEYEALTQKLMNSIQKMSLEKTDEDWNRQNENGI